MRNRNRGLSVGERALVVVFLVAIIVGSFRMGDEQLATIATLDASRAQSAAGPP